MPPDTSLAGTFQAIIFEKIKEIFSLTIPSTFWWFILFSFLTLSVIFLTSYIKSDYFSLKKSLLSFLLLCLLAPFYALIQSAPWITDGIMGACVAGVVVTYLFPSMTIGWKIIRGILSTANKRFEQEIDVEEFSQKTRQEMVKKVASELREVIKKER
jgi:hypothetical protein